MTGKNIPRLLEMGRCCRERIFIEEYEYVCVCVYECLSVYVCVCVYAQICLQIDMNVNKN